MIAPAPTDSEPTRPAPTAPIVASFPTVSPICGLTSPSAPPMFNNGFTTSSTPVPTDSFSSPNLFFMISSWPAKVLPSDSANPPTVPVSAAITFSVSVAFPPRSVTSIPIFFKAPAEPSEALPTAFAAESKSIPIRRDKSTTKGVSPKISDSVRPNCTSKPCADAIASSSAAVTPISAEA